MATPSKHAAHANEVRIIGGDYRGRRIRFMAAPGLRPTPDRARETLFNWLGQDLVGWHCLDAFAGSGALGFEAASRHAARVIMLDAGRATVDMLKKNRDALKANQVEVVLADALQWMSRCQERFDLVLLDPPFDSNLMQRAMPVASNLVKAEGWLYLEQAMPISAPAGFMIYREGTAGLSHFALLKKE